MSILSEEEDSDDSTTKTRTRSRKYTASDFMRDFEEEELLVRGGSDIDNVDVLAARSTSQTRISNPQVQYISFIMLNHSSEYTYGGVLGVHVIETWTKYQRPSATECTRGCRA